MLAQASYNKMVAEKNARLADLSAEDAIRQGDRDASELQAYGEKIQGAQRAGFAAQGVKVDVGSAKQVQAETAGKVARDVVRIKNNAWKVAWGYRVEAENQRTAGAFGMQAAQNAANNTILTGGLKAGGSFIEAFGKSGLAGKMLDELGVTKSGGGGGGSGPGPYGWGTSGGLM